MHLKNIIRKGCFYLIFLSIFSCGDDKLNSTDTQSLTNIDSSKTTFRNSIQDSDTSTFLNLISEKNSMIWMDGELMDCIDGSTIELSCCARYIADSLTLVIDELCDSLIADLANSIKDYQLQLTTIVGQRDIQYLNEEISCHKSIKEDLIRSQKYFLVYMKSQLELVGSLVNGNGRVLFQNEKEVELLEQRIAELKKLFWVE